MLNNQATKEILKPLERIASKGHHIGSVFRDWVSLMLYALMRDDDLYLEVMGRYKNDSEHGQREADYFANAFSILMKWSARENHDLLGDVYMEIASNYSSKSMGQFFTPVNLCEAMADIVMNDEQSESPVSVADPACGSARNLISAAKRSHANSLFVGIDLDTVCVRMSAINCCMFNMNAIIFHGNTLSMKFYDAFQTTRTPLGGTVRMLTEDELSHEVRRMENGLKDLSEQQKQKEVLIEEDHEDDIITQLEPQLTLFE